jgi:hypothetical protein
MNTQLKLAQSQIEAFYVDCFAESQVNDFLKMTNMTKNDEHDKKNVVDVGGGVGYFARELQSRVGCRVRVIDSDAVSIGKVKALKNISIESEVGDALNPKVKGNEDFICFNLILHHLIGKSEKQTRELQKKALLAWKNTEATIFVNEYIYESYVKNFSGRLIYEITSSKFLSVIGSLIARINPSLKANTFGVGVRFRANREWIKLFEECGFKVISATYGEVEQTTIAHRVLLLIRQVRRDSFLLVKRYPPPY